MHFTDDILKNLKKSSSLPKTTEIRGGKICTQTMSFHLILKNDKESKGIKDYRRKTMKCNKLAPIVPMSHIHHVSVASTNH